MSSSWAGYSVRQIHTYTDVVSVRCCGSDMIGWHRLFCDWKAFFMWGTFGIVKENGGGEGGAGVDTIRLKVGYSATMNRAVATSRSYG